MSVQERLESAKGMKGDLMLRLTEFPEDKKLELIEKYKNDDEMKSYHSQCILVGSWFMNAVNIAKRGATEEEIDRIIEFMVLIIASGKQGIDIPKAYADRALFELMKKYYPEYGLIKTKTVEGDEVVFQKETLKKREEAREKLKEHVMKLRDKGLEIHEIAEAINKPESTVRNLLK